MLVELFSALPEPTSCSCRRELPVTSAEGLLCAELQQPQASRRPARARPSPNALPHARNSLTNSCHGDTNPAACTLTHAAPSRSPLLPLSASKAVFW